MAVSKDGNILCVFENGEGDYCVRMSIAQVDREWILAGDPPEPEKEPRKK